jgi:hypothetical protein
VDQEAVDNAVIRLIESNYKELYEYLPETVEGKYDERFPFYGVRTSRLTILMPVEPDV